MDVSEGCPKKVHLKAVTQSLGNMPGSEDMATARPIGDRVRLYVHALLKKSVQFPCITAAIASSL